MTSKRDCYVYIQLPGALQVVTCGRYELAQRDDGLFEGRFVYGRTYRENPQSVELDKFELPLKPGTFETMRMNGIFGALRDASPDAWGRRVIEKELGRSDLTELDFLLHSPDDRAGALSFGLNQKPPGPTRRFNQTLALPRILAAAERLQDEDTGKPVVPLPEANQVDDLVNAGTSMGGARPKAVVEDANALWVAKFPMRGDRWNNAPVEAAMLMLARECSIHTPERPRVGNPSCVPASAFFSPSTINSSFVASDRIVPTPGGM